MSKGRTGRSTVYNSQNITKEEFNKIHNQNKGFLKEFARYCKTNDRSPQTIHQYTEQLKIFFIWNLRENNNTPFIDIRKREFISFFGWGRGEMGWSPNRLSSFRSVLSSLSNYIERIWDEEYPQFRNVIKVLEPIYIHPVREKTVVTEEQYQEALDHFVREEHFQEACWLALLWSSGMRKAEAVQMQVDFFTPDKIIHDCMYVTDKIRTKGKGARGKVVERYVFKDSFDTYLNLWLKQREELGIKSPWLFVATRGGTFKPDEDGVCPPAAISTLNSWAKRVGDIIGVSFYNHSLRHAFVTRLKQEGYPDAIIQLLQNWSDISMVSLYNDTSAEDELGAFFQKLNEKREQKEKE